MVLPLLAAIPTLISAVSGSVKLFNAGKQIVEDVTGSPSAATNEEELHHEVASMTPEQQTSWAEKMKVQVEAYQAETDRLEVQSGRVDAETLTALSPTARDKVALMRMTTRPWAVRKMVHVMLLPFYVTLVDMTLGLTNALMTLFNVTSNDSVVQVSYVAAQFFGENTLYNDMYQSIVWPAASIVMTYMTLRQMQKKKGDANPVDGVLDAVKQLGGLFGKVRR